ncbi:MAG: DUF2306 domain-containing protein [Bacteroidetes bacterium]|nr:DUF2306 domain-containing protein [Bacteroidota bacterium]
MSYDLIRDIHLYTIAPCVPLGFYLIVFSKKGGPIHKRLGKVYAFLMVFSSLVSLWLPAHVGPQWLGHFGWIHSLSLVTIASVPYSLWQLRRGNIRSHKFSMLFLYWTGLLIAGAFTLVPGRYLHEVVFG